MDKMKTKEATLVTRKACFGLPTACPSCLPIYIYLKFAHVPFQLIYSLNNPNSDQIPYVEFGASYVAYSNERGGVIESLEEDFVNLNYRWHFDPDKWILTKKMISSWLADAVMYELWVVSNGSYAHKIYYSDLPWLTAKVLYFKKVLAVKKLLGVTMGNAKRKEQIYNRATTAYLSLSTMLGNESYLFGDRPTSLDASFVGHALFTLHALPETSLLRAKLLEHTNLVSYAKKFEIAFIGKCSSASSPLPSDSSSWNFDAVGFLRGFVSSWKRVDNHQVQQIKEDDDISKDLQSDPEEYQGEWNAVDSDDYAHIVKDPHKPHNGCVYNWDGPPVVSRTTGYRVWDWDANETEKNSYQPLPMGYPITSPVSLLLLHPSKVL